MLQRKRVRGEQGLGATSSLLEIPGARTDRTALVTGASSGIGKEIARQLGAAGLTVYVGSRTGERGQRAVDEIAGNARLIVLDVTDAASVADAAAQVADLDVLINNAGVMIDGRTATDADVDSFRRTYETNVFGVVSVTNAFLPALRRSAHPRIVNISSGTGSLGWSTGPNPQFAHETGGTAAAYRSSKTALNALTVYYAQALASEGFKVNAVAPGLRATNLNARAAASGGDPGEAAAGAVRLALLPDEGPTGGFFSWDGSVAPW
jgi:NAD(P)-dependent dehydrogenase (short-subunit alcohol dehydrogenase family)